MNVVFFSHYFPPEGNAPASRTYDHCSRWVKKGTRVQVITCAPNVPDGEVYEGYRNRFWPQKETIDGIEVIRVWTYLKKSPGKLDLILNYVSYLVTALFAFLFFVRRPKVIVATTPQFFCGIAAVLASWLKWCPLVLEVRDIWPESIVTVGAIRRGIVIRVLESMERWMYRSAAHIVAVGPGYRENILGKVDVADRISMVTNGVDTAQYIPRDGCDDIAKRYDLGMRFVCSYVGTIGMAHGLDVVVRVAERLREMGREDIVFLLVGGGTKLESMKATVAEKNLNELIKFTGRLDKSEVPNALAASDVCLVHLSKVDLFKHVIPSKIFETMAMERPIIMGVRGRAREIVLAAGSGVAMEPEDDSQLYELLDQLSDDRDATRAMGTRGRTFVSQYFDRDQLADDMLQIIRRTAAGEVFVLTDREWEATESVPVPVQIDSLTVASNPVQ
ncbi:MAG: glycosyltransferase family 4 protein [Planctomycetota bacterium]